MGSRKLRGSGTSSISGAQQVGCGKVVLSKEGSHKVSYRSDQLKIVRRQQV